MPSARLGDRGRAVELAERSLVGVCFGHQIIAHALGGEVVLHGDAYDDAYAHARELEKREGLVFIHPFDDPDVIAGQGTIGAEILEQAETEIDAIFVPIGGGGLIAGIAAYVKAVSPDVRIIGVEPYLGHKIQGLKNLKEAYVPGIYDASAVDEKINIDDLITHTMPLEDINSAFDLMHSGESIRSVVIY